MILKKCIIAESVQICSVALLLTSSVFCFQSNTSSLATSIEQRYYMIMRLKKPIATLVEAYKKKGSAYETKETAHLFKHPLIHRTFMTMERTRSSLPFYKLWGFFLSYKFVEDKEFIREMLTAILLLYKELILDMHKDMGPQATLVASLDKRIKMLRDADSEIDYCRTVDDTITISGSYKALCPTVDCHEINAALTSHHTIESLSYMVSSDSIEEQIGTVHNLFDQDGMDTIAYDNTMRFYYIQRLMKSVFLLSRQKKVIPFVFNDIMSDRLTCPSLRVCIKELSAQQNVTPLFRVWSQITAYDFIHDTEHVHEFALITCLVYKQILATMTSPMKALASQDVLNMYEKLATLPVSELLDLLDDVVEQYDMLATHYALKDSSLSWKEWLEKYWWSAPIMVGSFITTLLKHAKIALIFNNNKSFFKKEANSDTM